MTTNFGTDLWVTIERGACQFHLDDGTQLWIIGDDAQSFFVQHQHEGGYDPVSVKVPYQSVALDYVRDWLKRNGRKTIPSPDQMARAIRTGVYVAPVNGNGARAADPAPALVATPFDPLAFAASLTAQLAAPAPEPVDWTPQLDAAIRAGDFAEITRITDLIAKETK